MHKKIISYVTSNNRPNEIQIPRSLLDTINKSGNQYQYFGYETNIPFASDEVVKSLANKLFEIARNKDLTLYYFAFGGGSEGRNLLSIKKGYWRSYYPASGKERNKLVDFLNETITDKSHFNMHSLINNKLILWTTFPVPSLEATYELLKNLIYGSDFFFLAKEEPNEEDIVQVLSEYISLTPHFNISTGIRIYDYESIFHKIILKQIDKFGLAIIFSTDGLDLAEIYLNIVSKPEIGKFDLEKES